MSPVLRGHFIDRSEEFRHGDERDVRLGVVDGGKLTQPRRIDPDRHRGVRGQWMVRVLRVQVLIVERGMCRREPELSIHSVVVVMVQRRTQEVARHHQQQQPARKPPCAAHVAGAAARIGVWAYGERHGRFGKAKNLFDQRCKYFTRR